MPEVPSRPYPWRGAVARWVIAACALALLLTMLPMAARQATAVDLTDRIAATRNGQAAAERAMRRADGVVVRLYKERRAVKKSLKSTKTHLRRTKHKRTVARRRADNSAEAYRAAYFARQKAEADGTKPPVTKRQVARLLKLKQKHGKWARFFDRMVGRIKVTKSAQKRRMRIVNGRIGAARARRNQAEGVLVAHIVAMTRLAQARVASSVDAALAPNGTGFSWPTEGRLTQGYGCTGSIYSPPRGSCKHFHDGLDIANVSGTPIRAVAAGVVAFVGWNPWDEGGRAFIMVVAHPDGFVSRYGHMLPIRKVRPGQIVKKGQVIARMGSTGRSTGSHLHVELLKGSSDVNPMAYFPANRAIKIPVKKAKPSKAKLTKAQKKAKARKQAAQRKKAAGVKAAKARKAARRGNGTAKPRAETATVDICDEAAPVVVAGAGPSDTPARALAAMNDGDGVTTRGEAMPLAVEVATDCQAVDPTSIPAVRDTPADAVAAVATPVPSTRTAREPDPKPSLNSLTIRARSSSPRPQ